MKYAIATPSIFLGSKPPPVQFAKGAHNRIYFFAPVLRLFRRYRNCKSTCQKGKMSLNERIRKFYFETPLLRRLNISGMTDDIILMST